METFLLLIVLIEEVIQMQDVKENSTRRWTPEDKDCNGIIDYKYHSGRAMQKVQS